MPILLGVVLGVFLTVAGAFVYDTTTGRAPNGLPPSAAGGNPPMVNWDVVAKNLDRVTTLARAGWKKIAGRAD